MFLVVIDHDINLAESDMHEFYILEDIAPTKTSNKKPANVKAIILLPNFTTLKT